MLPDPQPSALPPLADMTAHDAVTGGAKSYALSFLYAVVPVLSGLLVMLGVALAVNNMAPGRRCPEYWL